MNSTRRRLLQAGFLGGIGSMLSPLSSSARAANEPTARRVRGIIFMVSDGMSPGVLTLAQNFSLQTRNKGTRWCELTQIPTAVQGLMDTASASSLVTDSAAAASSWGGGQRIPNGQINVTASGSMVEPLAATLRPHGLRFGLVTTASVTHATPAGFAANIKERDDEANIAPQYLDRVDVMLGGGIKFFSPDEREDKRDMYADFARAGYGVVKTRDEMLASKSKRLLGTFYKTHLPYTLDLKSNPELAAKIPTLAEMSGAALDRFLAEDKPFFLMIEGARIDHAAHANDIASLLHEQLAFDDALASVLSATAHRDDILVVVTSDHGNANPGLNGVGNNYCQTNDHFARISPIRSSHENLFIEWKSKPGSTEDLMALIERRLAIQATKPEAEALLETLTGKEVIEWDHLLANSPGILGQIVGNHTGIGWTSTGHTSDPTLITATGPGADLFHGFIRNDSVHTKVLSLLLG